MLTYDYKNWIVCRNIINKLVVSVNKIETTLIGIIREDEG